LISKWSRPIFNITSDYQVLKDLEKTFVVPTESPKRPRVEKETSTLDSVVDGDLARRSQAEEKKLGVWYPRRNVDTVRRINTKQSLLEEPEEEETHRRSESQTVKQIRDRMSQMKKTKTGAAGDTRAFTVKLNSLPRLHERK